MPYVPNLKTVNEIKVSAMIEEFFPKNRELCHKVYDKLATLQALSLCSLLIGMIVCLVFSFLADRIPNPPIAASSVLLIALASFSIGFCVSKILIESYKKRKVAEMEVEFVGDESYWEFLERTRLIHKGLRKLIWRVQELDELKHPL